MNPSNQTQASTRPRPDGRPEDECDTDASLMPTSVVQKEVMILSSANPAEVERYLKGIYDPANKDDLIKHAQQQGANQDVIEVQKSIRDQSFKSPIEVSKAVGEIDRQQKGPEVCQNRILATTCAEDLNGPSVLCDSDQGLLLLASSRRAFACFSFFPLFLLPLACFSFLALFLLAAFLLLLWLCCKNGSDRVSSGVSKKMRRAPFMKTQSSFKWRHAGS